MNDLDSLTIFNTLLGIMNMSKNEAQQETLHRIEEKLDLLLKERNKNEDNQGNTN